ncbi:hypothetical protein K474DRAFT_1684266 [Panus rudis PR-1116 ss-1]|nr:hypothetical protein K474DRAFT_1684266 [Panus rudis PR-1116 ss-1]
MNMLVAEIGQEKANPQARSGQAQINYTSEQFVLSAGAIPFLRSSSSHTTTKILLVHHTKKDEWLLAKGRKDQGEDLAAAATREVFEETGYRCHLLPIPRLPTRAPVPTQVAGDLHQPDIVRIHENSTEPIAITVRPTGVNVKLIFWYVGYVNGADVDDVPSGTHMEAEGFGRAAFFDVEEALERLTFQGDRDLVRLAADLMK